MVSLACFNIAPKSGNLLDKISKEAHNENKQQVVAGSLLKKIHVKYIRFSGV